MQLPSSMQTYVIEYSDGPHKHRQAGAYPESFRELNRRLLAERVHIFRKLRVGTISSPYRFMEVIEGEPRAVRKYTDAVHEIFGGPLRVRRAYPIEEEAPITDKRRSRLDRVDRAGVESFPASDPPSWSVGIS